MEITKEALDNRQLGKWKKCIQFCVANGVGVIPLQTEQLISPYLTSALTFAMLKIENSYDCLFLMAGSASRSPLGDTSTNAIWRAVEALYGEPEVWLLISKSREFALMRSRFFRQWYPMYFASEGRTCRRASLFSPLLRRGKIWTLEPTVSPDNAYDHLAAVFRGMNAVGVLDGYLAWKLRMYRLETKMPEHYMLLDFLWMLELCSRLRNIPLMVLPITAKTWTSEGIKAGALLHAPESIGLPTRSGTKFLGMMLVLPFLGAALGTAIGTHWGNWKLGGFCGLMAGMTLSVLGQLLFFQRNR